MPAVTLHAPVEADTARVLIERPAVATLLRFADVYPAREADLLQRQAHWLHQPTPLAVAPLTAAMDLGEGFDPDAFWLRLDPVHLVPDRDTLVLFTAEEAGIEPTEARALVDAFNAHFAVEGVQLQHGAADRWYLSLPQPVDIETVPLHAARHANLHHVQPRGHSVSQWNRLINEAQMLFFQHPVNERRREAGLPEINGLWLWGEGGWPDGLCPRPELTVVSHDPFVQAVARAIEAEIRPLEALPAQLPEALYVDLSDVDPGQWVEAWLAPAIQRVRGGEIDSLLVDLGGAQAWHLTPAAMKKFWRRWRRPRLPEPT
ncbi:hypothetical protein [Sulfurivirga sp.]|uniref:hypothetical protein n=1 Tax=Sulfurivirga sp. TaxID=2614236 RepID=UPI0025CE8971|nr:hypothetical protein [Sulfurivirga sp.]